MPGNPENLEFGTNEWDDIRFMIDYYIPEDEVDNDKDKLFEEVDANGHKWHIVSGYHEASGEPALIVQTRIHREGEGEEEDSARAYAFMPESKRIEVFGESAEGLLNTDPQDEEVVGAFDEARKMGLLVPNPEEIEELAPILAIGRAHRTNFDNWAEKPNPN